MSTSSVLPGGPAARTDERRRVASIGTLREWGRTVIVSRGAGKPPVLWRTVANGFLPSAPLRLRAMRYISHYARESVGPRRPRHRLERNQPDRHAVHPRVRQGARLGQGGPAAEVELRGGV